MSFIKVIFLALIGLVSSPLFAANQATLSLKTSDNLSIPFIQTESKGLLTNLNVISRKTNETRQNEYDRSLKSGSLYLDGISTSKRYAKSLNYFSFTYELTNPDLLKSHKNMAVKFTSHSRNSEGVFLIATNITTDAKALYKLNSLELKDGIVIMNVLCKAQYNLVKDKHSMMGRQTQEKWDLLQRDTKSTPRSQLTRQDRFDKTRLLNAHCFLSSKDKNVVSFQIIPSSLVSKSARQSFQSSQYQPVSMMRVRK